MPCAVHISSDALPTFEGFLGILPIALKASQLRLFTGNRFGLVSSVLLFIKLPSAALYVLAIDSVLFSEDFDRLLTFSHRCKERIQALINGRRPMGSKSREGRGGKGG